MIFLFPLLYFKSLHLWDRNKNSFRLWDIY